LGERRSSDVVESGEWELLLLLRYVVAGAGRNFLGCSNYSSTWTFWSQLWRGVHGEEEEERSGSGRGGAEG